MGLVKLLESDVDRLDVQALRIIRAIGDHGSVTAAAIELGYSQPAVSQQLRKIESRLGIAVVRKQGRSLRLTQAGEVLARCAITVNNAIRAAADEISNLSGLRSGSVTLAAFPTASSTVVPCLLGELTRRHPRVLVSFREAEPPEAVALLSGGAVDLAITFSYPGDRADPHDKYGAALRSVPLWRDEMVLVLPRTHPLAERVAADVSEFADEAWIAGCPLCRGNLLSICADAGFQPEITHETDNMGAVINLVNAGLGIALIPRLALAAATPPPGVSIVSTTPRSYRTINLVGLADFARLPSNTLVAQLLSEIGGEGWSLEPVAGVRSRLATPR